MEEIPKSTNTNHPEKYLRKCERRINIEYLISGYSRLNTKSSSFVPASVLNVVSYFYPSMNGHRFIWKITGDEVCDIKTIGSKVIDSDVFDVGLSNKFFLRLELNSSATQELDIRGSGGRGGGRGGYRGRGRRGYRNNIYYNYNNDDRKSENNDDDDDDRKSRNNDEPKRLLLSLMSFPLSKPFINEIFHCELYCYQLNAQYSTIWSQSARDHRPADAQDYNNYDERRQRDEYNANEYIQHGWVINCDLSKQRVNNLTFECKLNILQIIFANRSPYTSSRRYRGGYGRGGYGGYGGYGGGYRGGYGDGYTGRYGDDDQYRDDDEYKFKSYRRYDNYAALPLVNNKIRFIWDIVDKSIISTLTNYCDYKGVIQYHSDVFSEIFQLQIGRANDNNYFQIQICGLPKNTHRMGVKLELFAMANHAQNMKDNKIKIMSNIVTFSYRSPLYVLSNDKCDILIDLLSQNKILSILCVANIIHKYDVDGNTVKNEIKSKVSIHENNKNNELNISSSSSRKWFELETESFVWDIRNNELLNNIKKEDVSQFNINSDIFELFGFKWFISIYKQKTTESNNILIVVNCILNKGYIDCMMKIDLVQSNHKQQYYQKFTNKWWGEYCSRVYNKESNGNIQCLLVSQSNIEKLDKICIKITIGIINDESTNNNKYVYQQNDEMIESKEQYQSKAKKSRSNDYASNEMNITIKQFCFLIIVCIVSLCFGYQLSSICNK